MNARQMVIVYER